MDTVSEFIKNFAIVNKIEELTPKYNYYRSFHVEVNDCYNNGMLAPEPWPNNVKVRRFYQAKEKKCDNNNQNNDQMEAEASNTSTTQ